MTLIAARNAVQQEIDLMWPVIQQAQADRLAAHGSYLQRRATHTVWPSDAVARAQDNVADKPTDESETGTEYMAFPANTYTCTTIHVWKEGSEQGYVCHFEFDWSATGLRQRYTISGPSGDRLGWMEFDPNGGAF